MILKRFNITRAVYRQSDDVSNLDGGTLEREAPRALCEATAASSPAEAVRKCRVGANSVLKSRRIVEEVEIGKGAGATIGSNHYSSTVEELFALVEILDE